jgi:hypothetical protein
MILAVWRGLGATASLSQHSVAEFVKRRQFSWTVEYLDRQFSCDPSCLEHLATERRAAVGLCVAGGADSEMLILVNDSTRL